MADVVMVKTEDDDPSDGAKTQVILPRQPITHGVCEVTGEMGTAVVAVETHNEDSAAEGEGVQYGYPITCGGSRAVLLFKKFVCPGINVRCVQYNDQLISPKQFVHLAGKATLKDWKRAIRLGGVMLRKMMDSGQIDFYQHDTVCTNTCRSTKFDLLVSSSRFPPPGGALPASVSPQGNGGPIAMAEDQPEETVATAAEWTPSVATAIATATESEIQREMGGISAEDPLSFWRAVADEGLMAEVVSNIRTELLALLRDIQQRCGEGGLQEHDAVALSTLAQMLGLLGSVKQGLQRRWCHTEQNQEQHPHRALQNQEQHPHGTLQNQEQHPHRTLQNQEQHPHGTLQNQEQHPHGTLQNQGQNVHRTLQNQEQNLHRTLQNEGQNLNRNLQKQERNRHRPMSSLDQELEEQKKPRDWSQRPQALPSMHLSTPQAPKRPRLQRPASSSVLTGPSPSLSEQRSSPAPITHPSVVWPIGSQLRTSSGLGWEEGEEEEREEEDGDGMEHQEHVEIIQH